MTGLTSVMIKADKTIASLEAGATWLVVFTYLAHLGVAVASSQNAALGVGGLNLGGFSFLPTPEHYPVLTMSFRRWYFLLCTASHAMTF